MLTPQRKTPLEKKKDQNHNSEKRVSNEIK